MIELILSAVIVGAATVFLLGEFRAMKCLEATSNARRLMLAEIADKESAEERLRLLFMLDREITFEQHFKAVVARKDWRRLYSPTFRAALPKTFRLH
jgi:hypothetical protein